MQQRSAIERIEVLERKVEVLELLPERVAAVEWQLVQLRDEMRAEFSALRGDMRTGDEETRGVLGEEIRAGDEETRRTLREEIRAGDEETRRVLRGEIRASDEETRRTLREEIRGGDEETRQLMRVLHEDVISRLATIQEGRPARKRKQ